MQDPRNSAAADAAEPSVDPATTGRYDSYLVVHKALRALMADTLVSLGRMDPGDDVETRVVIDKVRLAISLGQTHLAKEETFVHPAMEARAPGSTRRATTEHAAHAAAFARILAACSEVEAARGAVRGAAALSLYRRFALLMAEDLLHMDAEETENNAILWATYSDAEILQIVERLVASIPPDALQKYLRWMVTANAPQDRERLLNGIRTGMPAPAFSGLLDSLLPHLPDRDRRRLVAAVA